MGWGGGSLVPRREPGNKAGGVSLWRTCVVLKYILAGILASIFDSLHILVCKS